MGARLKSQAVTPNLLSSQTEFRRKGKQRLPVRKPARQQRRNIARAEVHELRGWAAGLLKLPGECFGAARKVRVSPHPLIVVKHALSPYKIPTTRHQ